MWEYKNFENLKILMIKLLWDLLEWIIDWIKFSFFLNYLFIGDIEMIVLGDCGIFCISF